MEFINTGLDERILKSLDVEHPSEELVKAMNKQGLVQKEVTVQGKNGTFTRKQWVKASEGVKTDSSSSKTGGPVDISKFSFTNYRNPDGQNRNGYKTYRDSLQSVANETEKAATRVLSTYGGSMKPYDQLRIEFSNINGHSSYRDMISNSSEQGLKDAKSAILARQRELLESVKDYTKWDSSQRKWVKDSEAKDAGTSQSTMTQKDSKSNKPSLSDIQGYGYDPATATGDPTYLKIGNKGYFKIGDNKWQYSPSQGSALGGTYTDSQISDMVSKTSEEVKVIPSAKKNSKATQSDASSQKSKSSEVFNCTKFNTEEQLVDAFDEAINSGEDSTSDYDVNKVIVTKVEKYMGNGVKGRGTTPRVRITAEVSGVQNGKPFTKETTLSTLDTTKSSQSSTGQKLSTDKGFTENGDGSYTKPLVISNGSESYQLWVEGTHIKGSMLGKQDSHNARDIKDFTQSGFGNFDEVKDYVKKYFFSNKSKTNSTQATGQKLSPADAKKKTQEITKGVSDKKSFMEKAKAQGITWKENDHEGINWMRCCMAMNKHFENGGNFDEK